MARTRLTNKFFLPPLEAVCAGGGKINVCHNACLLIINKVFAMAKLHLFFVNNKHFAFFIEIFLSLPALCYYLRLRVHFST